MRHHLFSLALIAGAVAWPAVAPAQQWRFGVDAGRIRSTLDPVARQSVSLAAGAGYESPSAAFRVTAGIPTPSDSVRWASLGAWKRVSTTARGFTGGIDLSGNAFAFRVPGSGTSPVGGGLFGFPPAAPAGSTTTGHAVAGQALPLIAYESGPVQVQARAGVSYHRATAGDAERERFARLGDLQLVFRPVPTLAIIPTLRHVMPRDEAAATFAGASGVVASGTGRAQLRAEIGRWISGVDESAGSSMAWSLGGELRVTPRTSLTASVRRSGADPVFLAPDQTSWTVGASFVFGGRANAPAAPVATRDARGVARIVLPVSQSAAPPRVAGDFNDWTPVPMERDGSSWRYTVAAAPGVYNYAFVAADGTWFVPEGFPGRKDDGMGGHVAVVVIR